jgi:hypothetical protein
MLANCISSRSVTLNFSYTSSQKKGGAKRRLSFDVGAKTLDGKI